MGLNLQVCLGYFFMYACWLVELFTAYLLFFCSKNDKLHGHINLSILDFFKVWLDIKSLTALSKGILVQNISWAPQLAFKVHCVQQIGSMTLAQPLLQGHYSRAVIAASCWWGKDIHVKLRIILIIQISEAILEVIWPTSSIFWMKK